MVTAVPLPSSDLSPQKIHQLLKQSPPEAQYKLRCSLHKDQVLTIELPFGHRHIIFVC